MQQALVNGQMHPAAVIALHTPQHQVILIIQASECIGAKLSGELCGAPL